MGLDWVLQKTKARPGSEIRFAEIELAMKKIEQNSKSQEQYEELTRELSEELESISIHAFEVVGAPRIGHDKRADDWFFENAYKRNHELAKSSTRRDRWVELWSKPFDEVVEHHKGKYVLEAAEEQGGVAAVTGIAVGSADFRGKVLRFCTGLPDGLVDESYEDHTGEECLDYAARLEEALEDVVEGDRDTVKSAIAWLRFWGEKGFGYWAWY